MAPSNWWKQKENIRFQLLYITLSWSPQEPSFLLQQVCWDLCDLASPHPPNSSHFHRPNLASVCTQYLIFLECPSLSSPHVSVLLLINSYGKLPGEIKTWPRQHSSVNKEKSFIIPDDDKGVGNSSLRLLLECKKVLCLWREAKSTKGKEYLPKEGSNIYQS